MSTTQVSHDSKNTSKIWTCEDKITTGIAVVVIIASLFFSAIGILAFAKQYPLGAEFGFVGKIALIYDLAVAALAWCCWINSQPEGPRSENWCWKNWVSPG